MAAPLGNIAVMGGGRVVGAWEGTSQIYCSSNLTDPQLDLQKILIKKRENSETVENQRMDS